MKPFDFNAAKDGAPLMTRGGKEVTQFTVFDARNTPYPCAAVVDGMVYTFTVTGKKLAIPGDQVGDLVMAPKKRTVFVNLHKQRDAGDITPFLYADEAYAKRQCGNSMNCLGTFPIEIED
jgi:hypothetical protein